MLAAVLCESGHSQMTGVVCTSVEPAAANYGTRTLSTRGTVNASNHGPQLPALALIVGQVCATNDRPRACYTIHHHLFLNHPLACNRAQCRAADLVMYIYDIAGTPRLERIPTGSDRTILNIAQVRTTRT